MISPLQVLDNITNLPNMGSGIVRQTQLNTAEDHVNHAKKWTPPSVNIKQGIKFQFKIILLNMNN